MRGRLLLCAPASGGGKTTVTCALLQALVNRGLAPVAFKSGPDYIDPMFHSQVIGAKSRNLDLFLMGEEGVRRSLWEHTRHGELAVIEGAMGYYDGIAMTGRASAWELARANRTPAVLVADVRGRALAAAALVQGMAGFRPDSGIRGVILNRISPMLYPRLKGCIEGETGLPVFGYLPELPGCSLESRHLGLVTAAEVAHLREKLTALAAQAEQSLDLEGLLALAASAPAPEPPRGIQTPGAQGAQMSAPGAAREIPAPGAQGIQTQAERPEGIQAQARRPEAIGVSQPGQHRAGQAGTPGAQVVQTPGRARIALARDKAFCFYYADALALLEELGAELAAFSPLEDEHLPQGCSGLYLGGGYPEEYAQTLAGNASLLGEIHAAVLGGMPTVAECGGFLYLHRSLGDADGRYDWHMAGAFSGRAGNTGKLGRFGYITMTARTDGLLCRAGESLPAHEFHYWDSTTPGGDFRAQKPLSDRGWDCGWHTPTLYAGFPHFHFGGCPEAARRFVEACKQYGRGRDDEPAL